MNAPFAWISLLWFLSAWSDVSLGEVTVTTPMKQLKGSLLKDYNTRDRPVLNHQNVTHVNFNLNPESVIDIDERRGIVYMEVSAVMTWVDEHLQWNPQEFSGIEKIHVSPIQIWRPDVRLFNSRSFWTAPWTYQNPSVDFRGRVTWQPTATFSIVCEPFDYALYPKDEHLCYLALGSWLETSQEIDYTIQEELKMKPRHVSSNNAQWEVAWFTGNRQNYPDAGGEPRVILFYDFKLRRVRVPTGYLGAVPDAVARLLILCIFWLPGLTKKLSLGCVTLVLLTVIIVNLYQKMPSPAAAPYALAEPTVALEMCMAAIILEIVVSFLAVLDVASPTILDSLSKVKVLQMITSGAHRPVPLIEEEQGELPDSPKAEVASNRWTFLGLLIDKVAFVVFAVLLLAV